MSPLRDSEEEDFSSDEKSPRIADSDSLYSDLDCIQLESLQRPEVAGLGRGPRQQPPLVQHLLRPRADIADREVVGGDEPAEEILLRGERALCDRTRSENTLRLSSCFQYGCSMVQRERVLSSGGMSACSKHGSAFVRTDGGKQLWSPSRSVEIQMVVWKLTCR